MIEIAEEFIDEVISCLEQEFYDDNIEWIEKSTEFMDIVERFYNRTPYEVARAVTLYHYLNLVPKEVKIKARREKRQAELEEKLRNKKPKKEMGRPRKYPINKMELHDTWEAPEAYSTEYHQKISATVHSYMKGKGKGKRFRIRRNANKVIVIRVK